MKIIKHYTPWNYFEVHDFLLQNDFKKLKLYAESLPVTTDRNMTVLRNGNIYNILSSAMLELCNHIDYKIPSSYDITVQLDSIIPNWKYNKIHNDNSKKFVTFVLAISDNGTGTHLYSQNKKDYIKTTDWIQNGGNGFIRTDNSWHDFDSVELTDIRRTAIIMLAKKDWDM